ncbi:MAG: hypothetical protein ABI091_26495 [Ferruginibacter sp.]
MAIDFKEYATGYAERICNGDFPITYSREQVVKHTKDDFIVGATYFQIAVLTILKENYLASKKLTDEDKIKSAQEILKETYEDLILIFSSKK